MTATSGLVIVDKPAGWTSHDVVAKLRRLARTRRVGHAGTLDPMATGVLVVGVERATRLLGHLALTEKHYDATIRLGQSTNTDDAEGETVAATSAAGVADAAVRAAAAALTGPIQQVPPQVSAIKVQGKRAYKRARAGEDVELAARPVVVHAFEVREVRPARPPARPPARTSVREGGDTDPGPGQGSGGHGTAADAAGPGGAGGPADLTGLVDVDVAVTCSSGTYIRALARDMGQALGVGGHLTFLRRTRVGPYDLAMARTIEELSESVEVMPMAEAVGAAFPRREVDAEDARKIAHGGRLPAAGLGPGPIGVYGPDGGLLALVEEGGGVARPLAVFVSG